MPEGPEVWILSHAVNTHNQSLNTCAIGKHLILQINDSKVDWSFGLTGKVRADEHGNIYKLKTGMVYGNECVYVQREKVVSWMTASEAELRQIVSSWEHSNVLLGALLLDQSMISGIGVAWGSEILHQSKLVPNMKANKQSLSLLVPVLISLRDEIKLTYMELLNNTKPITFINQWFYNLYAVRNMNVYKKGKQVKTAGRTWYVALN